VTAILSRVGGFTSHSLHCFLAGRSVRPVVYFPLFLPTNSVKRAGILASLEGGNRVIFRFRACIDYSLLQSPYCFCGH